MRVPSTAEIPLHLFKYRSIASDDERRWLHQTIVKSQIYWASPDQFNDPFDCAAPFAMPKGRARQKAINHIISRNELTLPRPERRQTRKRMKQLSDSDLEQTLSEKMPAMMAQTAVYSVGTAGDTVLMWSHYGACHQGVCLRFTARPLIEHFKGAFRVEYAEERPHVMVADPDPTEVVRTLMLTKAEWWRYEQEWRFIDYRGGAGLRRFPPPLLSGVILGAKIKPEDEILIREWVQKRGFRLDLLRARVDPRHFRLNVVTANEQ